MDERFKSERYDSDVESHLVKAIQTMPGRDSYAAGVAMTILWLQGKVASPWPSQLQKEK